jgi:hypothetical protein
MTDLIKRLTASGELVLYHDYRSRSLRDWSGQGNDGVGVNTPKWGGGNIRLDDWSEQSVKVANTASLNQANLTMLVLAQKWRPALVGAQNGDTAVIASRYTSGAIDFYWTYYGASVHYIYAASGVQAVTQTNPGNARLVAFNLISNGIGSLYTDGVFVGSLALPSTAFNSYGTNDLHIGGFKNAVVPRAMSRVGIQAFLYISRNLTATEHAQIYGELINMNWESKPGKHAWRNVCPVNVSANTVAQYDMRVDGTTVVDVSGNGRNGTMCGGYGWSQVQTPIGRGLLFKNISNNGGQAPYLDTGFGVATLHDTTDSQSVCIWQRLNKEGCANNSCLINRASSLSGFHGIIYNAAFGWAFYNAKAAPPGSYDTIAGPALSANNFNHLGWTVDAAGSIFQLYVDGEAYGAPTALGAPNLLGALNWRIGTNAPTSGTWSAINGTVAAPQFIKAVQDATWWKEQYRAGARAVQYAMGNGLETSLVASEGGVVGTILSNSPWRFADATARVKVGIEQVNGQYMKTLEGVTAGYLYAPIETLLGNDAPNSSYGTWEWYQYKTDAGAVVFAPVNTNIATPAAGTYYLEAAATEAATLVEQGVGNVFSQAGAFTHSVWQKVRLTRSYAGRWRLYVNDSFVVEATDNTSYTTNYWLLNLGVGCKIAGLTKYLGDMSV